MSFQNRKLPLLTGLLLFFLVTLSVAPLVIPLTVEAQSGISAANSQRGVNTAAQTPQPGTVSGNQKAAATPGVNQNPTPSVGTTKVQTNKGSGATGSTGVLSQIGQFIGNTILTIAAWFMGLGGSILDTVVEKLVLGMGTNLKSGTSIGNAIVESWTIIRDVANLAFIFGFIYIGVLTIYDYESANTKKLLAKLIIAALLINFSLLIAKVVVDVSNVLAISIFNAGLGNNGGHVGQSLLEVLRLKGIWTSQLSPQVLANLTTGGSFGFYIGAATFLLIAAFVFAAGGILLAIRYVALILLMIFSPILFAAMVFPQTQSYASGLWNKLISYSFFAPVYFLLLYITLKLAAGMQHQIGGNGASFVDQLQKGADTPGDFWGVILNFTVIIIFLIFALLAAQKFSIYGGTQAVKMGNDLRKWGQGVVGRNTIGAGANLLRKRYDSVDARMTKSRTGRNIRRLANVATLGLTTDRAIRGTLQAGEKEKFGSTTSFEDSEKTTKEIRTRRSRTQELQGLQRQYENAKDAPEGSREKIMLERAVSNASTAMLEELTQEQREGVAYLMTSSQVENLSKSDKLNETQVARIRDARSKATQAIYENNKDDLTKASVDHLTTMGADYLLQREHALRLNSSQMDELGKKLTKSEMKNISDAREQALLFISQGGSIDGKDSSYLLGLKPGEMSKLPADALKNLSEQLPVTTLAKISLDGTLKNTDQSEIRRRIGDRINNRPANITPDEDERLDGLDDWLRNSPVGKQFGK